MAIHSFLIIDISSGVTLHNRRYSEYGEVLDSDGENDILFSGAIVAIRGLMNEIKVGQVTEINTDESTILNAVSERFIIFCIGDFENKVVISKFLERIVALIESWVPRDGEISLSEDTCVLINAMFDDFVTIVKDKLVVSMIFREIPVFGYQPIVQESLSDDVERQLIGLLNRTDPELNIFLELLHTGNFVLLTKIKPGVFLVTLFGQNTRELSTLLSKRQVTRILAESYLPDDLDNRTGEVTDVLDFYNKRLEKLLAQNQETLTFFNRREIVEEHSDLLAVGYESVLSGRPIALQCTEEERDLAVDIISLLSYITLVRNVGLDTLEDFPKRLLVFSDSSMRPELERLGYHVLTLGDEPHTPGENLHFHTIQERTGLGNDMRQNILQWRTETMQLFDICKHIMLQRVYGMRVEEIIGELGEEKRIIQKMLAWINPQILGGNSLGEQSILW